MGDSGVDALSTSELLDRVRTTDDVELVAELVRRLGSDPGARILLKEMTHRLPAARMVERLTELRKQALIGNPVAAGALLGALSGEPGSAARDVLEMLVSYRDAETIRARLRQRAEEGDAEARAVLQVAGPDPREGL